MLPDPVLGRPCRPVRQLDEVALALAADLVDTMRASSHSVGVAAPQIGVSLRAFCIDVTGHHKARSCHGEVVLFNPVIVETGAGALPPEVGREGCMSVPDLTGDVARAPSLVVQGTTPTGAEVVLEVDAFEARAVQHELDHLDGLLFLDRVVAGERVFRRRRYR
ncbi:MAG: peptide deformylase [Actinobacteria bacterium]|nr:peptide deformylase [Actinomycetota bacterium]MBW3641918.1 peptide deformylase [Actinomycetota bacterium]